MEDQVSTLSAHHRPFMHNLSSDISSRSQELQVSWQPAEKLYAWWAVLVASRFQEACDTLGDHRYGRVEACALLSLTRPEQQKRLLTLQQVGQTMQSVDEDM